MEIRIGLELACKEVLDLARGGAVDKGKTIDLCIGKTECLKGAGSVLNHLLCLAYDEGEGKDELVVVRELE